MGAKFSHLFVHVASLARSKAFYVDALGLELLAGTAEDDSGYMRLGGLGGFTIGMEERALADVGAAGIEIVISVDDVDAMSERLAASGVRIDSGPADQPWGSRHAWVTDPDGYRVSIYSPSGS